MSNNHCKSSLRIIHNVYGAPAVNIFVNNKSFALNLNYKDFTSYLSIEEGPILINVELLDGTQLTSIESDATEITLTYILFGDINTPSSIQGKLFKEKIICSRPGYSRINFVNGVYDSPNIDVYANGVKIIDNIVYSKAGINNFQVNQVPVTGSSAYLVNLEVKLSGTETIISGPSPFYLISGGIYTFINSGTSSNSFIIFSHDNNNSCEILQPNFNVQNYMGKWNQIASIPQFYETNCADATAEYTLLSDRVNVFNTCYDQSGNVVTTITGSAYPGCNPASLRVLFPNSPQSDTPNYLVHKTNYRSYAIIGSPTRTSFYILSRRPKMSQSKYLKILKYASRLGYDSSSIKPNFNTLIHSNSETPIDETFVDARRTF